MLRLTQLFSLKEDVQQHYLKRSANGTVGREEGVLKEEKDKPSIAIVGHERGGITLVTRISEDAEDGKMKTFIDLYDMNKKKLITIYKHSERVIVLGCSVNEERTLIAFTIKRTTTANGDYEDVYESFIGELHPKGGCYPIVVKTKQAQKVKFLYSSEEGTGNTKRSMAYLLYFLNEEHINLYQISFRPRPDGGVKMTSLPTLKAVLAKNFLWCEWDTRRGNLYVITARTSKQSSGGDYILRCFCFPDRKPSLFEKEEKEINLLYDIPLQIRLSSNKFDPLYLFSFNIHEHLSRGSQHMHLVNMRGNALCLCQQHKLGSDSDIVANSIDISIFMLHNRTKLDITIPMQGADPSVVSETRVLFDSIGDLLLIYVPGFYCQLIDCGQDHGPAPSLTLVGPQRVPVLPGEYKKFEGAAIIPFDISRSENPNTPDLRGHALLECRYGIVYEFTFDLVSLQTLFEINSPEIHPTLAQALHLVIIHIQDKDLVQKIMLDVVSKSPQNATVTLMSEFIVGMSYLHFMQKVRTLTESRMERVMPVTCLEPYVEAQAPGKQQKGVKAVSMNGYNLIPGTKTPIKERDEDKRFPLSVNTTVQMPSPMRTQSSGSPVVSPGQQPGVKRFFKDLLGLDDEASRSNKSKRESETLVDEARRVYIDGLAAHLLSHFPKEKSVCAVVASEYPTIQSQQVEDLFKCISSNTSDSYKSFQVWENFYSCLEELGLPYPEGFHPKFLRLAYKCVSRNTFIQYLTRELVRVDEEFVATVAKSLSGSDSPEDQEFVYFLASRLTDQARALQVMRDRSNNHNYLIHYLISRVPTSKLFGSNFNGLVDMEVTDDSPFIPLSVFLHTIRGEKSVDFPWVKSALEDEISRTLRLSFPDSRELPSSSSTSELRLLDLGTSEEVLLRNRTSPYPFERRENKGEYMVGQSPSDEENLLLRKMTAEEIAKEQKQSSLGEEEQPKRQGDSNN